MRGRDIYILGVQQFDSTNALVGFEIICGYFGRNPKAPEWTRLTLGFLPSCVFSDQGQGTTIAEIDEIALMGHYSDGYVYEWGVGNSYDGAVITSFLRLPFNDVKNPDIAKRFHSGEIEMSCSDIITFTIGGAVDIESTDRIDLGNVNYVMTGGNADWVGEHEDGYSRTPGQTDKIAFPIDAAGKAVAIAISSETNVSDDKRPWRVKAMRVNYMPRKQMRTRGV